MNNTLTALMASSPGPQRIQTSTRRHQRSRASPPIQKCLQGHASALLAGPLRRIERINRRKVVPQFLMSLSVNNIRRFVGRWLRIMRGPMHVVIPHRCQEIFVTLPFGIVAGLGRSWGDIILRNGMAIVFHHPKIDSYLCSESRNLS